MASWAFSSKNLTFRDEITFISTVSAWWHKAENYLESLEKVKQKQLDPSKEIHLSFEV